MHGRFDLKLRLGLIVQLSLWTLLLGLVYCSHTLKSLLATSTEYE